MALCRCPSPSGIETRALLLRLSPIRIRARDAIALSIAAQGVRPFVMNKTSNLLLALIGAALSVATLIGTGMLWRYSLVPGTAGMPPALWPPQSRLARTAGDLTLVMVVHPHCPCSRASIAELEILMTHPPQRINADVVFLRPPGFDDSWTKTNLWRSATAIPGVSAVIDDGRETRLFGAATSGQTMVYGRDGNLLFSGGITAARGHCGDNAGAQVITTLLNQSTAKIARRTAVYGCALFAPPSSSAKRSIARCLR